MKSKNLLILAIVFGLLFLIPGILAATTLNNPAAGTNHTGTLAFNCTTTLADITYALNASLWYSSTGGAVDTMLVSVTNTSTNQTHFYSGSIDISSLTEASTYNMTCIVANASTTSQSSGNTGITIDNTAPTVLLNVPASSQSFNRPIDYMCTYTDSIDSSPTVTFNVSHPSGDDTSTTTLTASSSDFLQFTDTDYAGDYVFSCYVVDYTGNAAKKTATVSVDELGRLIDAGGEKTISNGGNKSSLVWIIAIIAILILISRRNR